MVCVEHWHRKAWMLLVLILGVTLFRIWQNNVPKHITKANTKSSLKVVSPFVVRNTTKYDFVALKQKSGWNFVNYPCKYTCEKNGVTVTVRYTKEVRDVVGADVVLFSTGPYEIEEWQLLQRDRTPDQIWIFATQEPAAIVPDYLPPKIYRHNTYNLSFTFHSTSHINGAYGWYTPRYPKTDNKINWFKSKTKFAVWVSSAHCDGMGWDRTKFVTDLATLIPVDMYGKCGNLSMMRNSQVVQSVMSAYKFHMSFENSCCSEYLTEKVWNALERFHSVPVVIGGTKEEYKKLMPPHSYIHADDFNSMAELTAMLHTVSENETLYNSYFDWMKYGSVHQQSFHIRFPVFKQGVCKVVDKLEKLKQMPHIYSFDPYGPEWFGSCFRCGENKWIQDYNFWWKRTMFRKVWEDNRTLLWMN